MTGQSTKVTPEVAIKYLEDQFNLSADFRYLNGYIIELQRLMEIRTEHLGVSPKKRIEIEINCLNEAIAGRLEIIKQGYGER